MEDDDERRRDCGREMPLQWNSQTTKQHGVITEMNRVKVFLLTPLADKVFFTFSFHYEKESQASHQAHA